MARPLTWLLLTALVVLHAVAVGRAWTQLQKSPHGRDYATYHYAAQVALEGGDPYDKAELGRSARREGTRGRVYPYLYPPSFLLAVAPVSQLSLFSAYKLWFWLGEVALALAVAALARWWAKGDDTVLLVLVAAVALSALVPDNLLMGQANLPVMALALGGLALAQGRRLGGEATGGVLIGLAIALKLSPVLLVGWWLLRGRWRPAVIALGTVATALGVSVLVFGSAPLLTFATDVLPTLSDGAYNGLGLPVGLFGNHGLPNLWHQLIPSGGRLLGTGARIAATVTIVGIGGVLLWAWGPPRDADAEHAQLAGVLVFGLLVPVFTYEHHLIWALPAVVLAVVGVVRGQLHPFWALPVGLAVAAWAADLASLKAIARAVDPVTGAVLREAKMGALIVLLAAMGVLGRGRWRRATGR